MTRKRILIWDEEFFLEPLSSSVVKVGYKDQVGWVGISRDCDINSPFAYQTGPLESTDEGIGNSLTATPTIRSALLCVAHHLKEMQMKAEALRINPQARRGMAQWALREFFDEHCDGAEL